MTAGIDASADRPLWAQLLVLLLILLDGAAAVIVRTTPVSEREDPRYRPMTPEEVADVLASEQGEGLELAPGPKSSAAAVVCSEDAAPGPLRPRP